jgi:hypothetical protein
MTDSTTETHSLCEQCLRRHAEGEPHCPNCGQPASSGFHASDYLERCPDWIEGRGWVPRAALPAEEHKAT